MFGNTPPTPSEGGVPVIIREDEGGRYHKPNNKEKEVTNKNNENLAIILSTWLINK